MCMHHIFSVYPAVHGTYTIVLLLWIITRSEHGCMLVSLWWDFISSGHMPKSSITGSYRIVLFLVLAGYVITCEHMGLCCSFQSALGVIIYCSQLGPKAFLGLFAVVVNSTAVCQLTGKVPVDSHQVLERPIFLSSCPGCIWMLHGFWPSWVWFWVVSRESLRTLEKCIRQPQPSSRSSLSSEGSPLVLSVSFFLMVWL